MFISNGFCKTGFRFVTLGPGNQKHSLLNVEWDRILQSELLSAIMKHLQIQGEVQEGQEVTILFFLSSLSWRIQLTLS